MAAPAPTLVLCTDGAGEADAVARLAAGFSAVKLTHRAARRCPRRGFRGRFERRGGRARLVLTAPNGATLKRAVAAAPVAPLVESTGLTRARADLLGMLVVLREMPAPVRRRRARRRPKAAPKPVVAPVTPEPEPAAPPVIVGPPPPPEASVLPATPPPAPPAPAPAPAVVAPTRPATPWHLGLETRARWRPHDMGGLQVGAVFAWAQWALAVTAQPRTDLSDGGLLSDISAVASEARWRPVVARTGPLAWRLPLSVGVERSVLAAPGEGEVAYWDATIGAAVTAEWAWGPITARLAARGWWMPAGHRVGFRSPRTNLHFNHSGAGLGLGVGWGR